jgi:hypothetical protein
MQAIVLYALLRDRFPGLKPAPITKGRAFYLGEVRRQRPSTRVVRIHERADGTVAEVKLSMTALGSAGAGILRAPFVAEEICSAVGREILMLEQQSQGTYGADR